MADIELVIKIPEEAKQAFDCAESNDLKGCYYDHGGVIGNAIKKGTPLPKGYGRLIDADEIQFENTEFDYCIAFDAIDEAEPIIEADKAERNDKE